MDFSLNDEQKMLIETVRRFIAEECQPLEDEIEQTGSLEHLKYVETALPALRDDEVLVRVHAVHVGLGIRF